MIPEQQSGGSKREKLPGGRMLHFNYRTSPAEPPRQPESVSTGRLGSETFMAHYIPVPQSPAIGAMRRAIDFSARYRLNKKNFL